MKRLGLLLAFLACATNARAGSPEQTLVDRLKKLGEVHLTYQGEGKDKAITGVDFRITGERKAEDVIAAVRDIAKLPKLDTVLLLGPAFKADAVKELVGAKLVNLTLFNTGAGDAAFEHLPKIKTLRILAVTGSGLTDKGLKEITKVRTLQSLVIEDARITDAGIMGLTALRYLQRLILTNTDVTPDALANLREAMPRLSSGPAVLR
ncbi:MAG: hypothetical protein U0793_12130 [Gemmataceae bacterium]